MQKTVQMSSKLQKVFVALPVPIKEALDLLHSQPSVSVRVNEELPLTRDKLLREVKGCHGIFCFPMHKIDRELLDTAGPQLKVISTCSVGYDHIDLEECRARNISVGHTPGLLDDAVAEFTIGLLLNTSRRISEAIQVAKTTDWSSLWNIRWLIGTGLAGSNVGIVGMGRIGHGIAARLAGFGVNKILYHNRSRNEKADALNYEYASFDDLLKQSDFVVAACSANKDSEKLFNASAFSKMKSGAAIFINISRGVVVDQDALYDALKSGQLLAAGLDVTTPQPLPLDHKLYTLGNCFITPYLAPSDVRTRTKMATVAVQNLINGLNDQPLLFPLKASSS